MTETNIILEEIRETRERMLAKHHGDMDALITELQQFSHEPLSASHDIDLSDSKSQRRVPPVPLEKVAS